MRLPLVILREIHATVSRLANLNGEYEEAGRAALSAPIQRGDIVRRALGGERYEVTRVTAQADGALRLVGRRLTRSGARTNEELLGPRSNYILEERPGSGGN